MDRSEQRRQAVLERLDRESFVTVARLAEDLACSQMTIRRDLTLLEEQGRLKRRRGGAVPTRMARLEFAVYDRARVNRSAKSAIAAAAAELVKPGQRIILDTGTTTLELAYALRGGEKLTVVTTSLAIVSALLPAPGVKCMLLGGTVRETSPDLYGPLVEENLARIHADIAFVGCDGLSDEGQLTTTDHRVARATQLMIANASRAVLLTDSSKAGRSSFVTFAKLEDLEVIISDRDLPRRTRDLARKAGTEVITVKPDAH
jgi:DeoR/GlpR family transcriptional regulator of sugar metabolism